MRVSTLQAPACLTQVLLGEDEASPSASKVFQVPGRSADCPTVQMPSLRLEELEVGNSGVHLCHCSFSLVTEGPGPERPPAVLEAYLIAQPGASHLPASHPILYLNQHP